MAEDVARNLFWSELRVTISVLAKRRAQAICISPSMPQKPLWEPGALALEIFVTRLSQMSELKTIRSKRHLFLGGGGYKTLTFLSVLDVIGWSHWQSATGVSAGALLALMLALGYNFQESDEAVLEHEEEF